MDGPTAERILDAAERRLRAAGYNGFSFRDLAADVGIRSASVHHHFPTKEALVERVVLRHRERLRTVLHAAPAGAARIRAYRGAFRDAVVADLGMCLCGILGAESAGLPASVCAEMRGFFQELTRHLAEGLEGEVADPHSEALRCIATLEGAIILARAFGDIAVYDRATENLARAGPAVRDDRPGEKSATTRS